MRFVVTCSAPDVDALVAAAGRAALGSRRRDRVEARLDLLERPAEPADLARLSRAAGGLLLATCRRGGSGTPAGEADRLELLRLAAREGAAAVDLEEDAPLLDTGRAQVWRSLHLEREPSPEEAEAAIGRLLRAQPAVVKLAAPCSDAASGLAWVGAARRRAGARPSAVVPMGRAGRGLRLLAGRGLSDFLYCAEDEPVAEGQPRRDDAVATHAAGDVDESTPLHAVVGHPLERSWSPLLHSALSREIEHDTGGLLVPLPVREAGAVLSLLDELGAAGAAVTMPHKRELARLVPRVSERVRRAGSLNSLRRGPEGWEGESFDGPAALGALRQALDPEGLTVAVLGAGGAAAALVAELAPLAGRVVVLARRAEAARELAGRLRVEHAPLEALEALRADLVVNATPVEPAEPLATRAAFDMRTTPADTHWLRRAAERGLAVVDGLSMFARQAAAQRRWWGLSRDGEEEVESRLRRLVEKRGAEAS